MRKIRYFISLSLYIVGCIAYEIECYETYLWCIYKSVDLDTYHDVWKKVKK